MIRLIRQNKWLVLTVFVIMTLFVSSSMTYQEQTSVPWLERYFADQPGRALLSGIRFRYAGSTISVASSGYFAFVEFFIRKGAHVGTYYLIGMSGFLGLAPYVKPVGFRILLTGLSACGLAALDEFHQQLTGGRMPSFDDVMLDTAAAVIAILLTILISALWRRKSRHGVVHR